MYPDKCDYVRVSSVAEAIQILSRNDEAKILAGGHSLIPAMKLRLAEPGLLIDIDDVAELKSIRLNGKLWIGALATHAQIAVSSLVQSHCVALAQAAGQIGDPQVRNFGTIGGNLAHADPASDPPTVILACDGVIHAQGSGGARNIAASDFFIDLFTVDLAPDEILTGVELPDLSGKKCGYAKMPHPASRYAVVGVCVALDMAGSTCNSASVAVGGATVKALRSPAAEAALVGRSIDEDALDQAANALLSELPDDMLMDDVSYPAHYRKQMSGVYLKRAIRAALS